MQTLKQKGFTLIELLVVIVIIGILATISVATFSGYFAKARDSERQAAIHNAATLMKTARAVDTITSFTLDKATVIAKLNEEGGYSMPAPNPGIYYYYASSDDNFVIFVCAEDSNKLISDGTSADLTALGAENTIACSAGVATLGNGVIGTAVGADSPGSFSFGA